MGTVYKRKDSSVWWIGFLNAQGKWEYRSTGSKDERLARRALEQIEAALASGRGVAGKPMTVAEWAPIAGAGWKNRNAGPDRRNVERHIVTRLGAKRLVDVTEADLRGLVHGWRDGGKLAPRTISNLWWLAQRLFEDAVKAKHLERSPCPELEKGDLPKKRDKDPRWRRGAVFTRGEAQQLIDGPDAWRRTVWALGFFTGMRLGEISALRWRDYDDQRDELGCLYVAASFTRVNKVEKGTKTDTPREVPVHPELAAMLVEWKRLGWREFFGRLPEPGDLVVPNQAGRHLTDNNVNGIRDLDFARLELRRRRYHDTRRTFFTLAQADGAQREVVYAITHNPGDSSRDMGVQYTTFPWPTLCAAVRGLKLEHRPPLRGLPTPRTTVTSEEDSTMQPDSTTSFAQEGIRTRLRTPASAALDDSPLETEPVEAVQRPSLAEDRRNVGNGSDLPARLQRLVARYAGARR